MISNYAKNAITLGLLAAIGPFAIDMYIPAMPTIASVLNASTAAVQMTLMVFFVAFGVCQIVYGPASDMIGRKPPLYFGLAVFVAGSIGCASAPGIAWLIFFRSVQGIGAASMMAIPRAIIRDLHTGVEAAKLMSLVMLVFSVSPILAPLAGSGLILLFGWRAVFVAVTVAALLGFGLLAGFLPETRPRHARVPASAAGIIGGFARLLQDRRFLGLTFIGGFGMASFFTFLASSSFVYINHFGLTPTGYAIAFSANAIGFIGASQCAPRLGGRFGMRRVVTVAVSCYATVAIALFAVTAAGVDSLPLLMGMLFAAFACLGLVIPSTMVLALEEHGPIAGMAAALGGTLQMITGGSMIAIISVISNGTALPMVTVIAACSLAALALSLTTPHGRRLAPQPAE